MKLRQALLKAKNFPQGGGEDSVTGRVKPNGKNEPRDEVVKPEGVTTELDEARKDKEFIGINYLFTNVVKALVLVY